MTSQVSVAMAELLADAQWVRALARALVADPHDADDLAQDACLLALRRPPSHGQNLRGWFQRVLENLVRQNRRAALRRAVREHATDAQAPPSTAPTGDLVERAATHRSVVDAVLRLDEPYRSTILLRFFENLPPREIAARQGVPVATVHSRLQRGCAQLRQRLDASHNGRRAWCAALLPMPRIAATLTFLEVLVMNGKALALGATLALGAVALWFGSPWFAAAPAPPMQDAPPAMLAVPPSSASLERVAHDATAAVRTEVVAPPAPVPVAAAPARQLAGRVVDGDGQPVAQIHVALDRGQGVVAKTVPRARSDQYGAFVLADETTVDARIVADEPGWQTVMHAVIRDGQPPRLALVVAAPKVALAGHVRSADGAALAAASVQLVWPADLQARLSDISDAATQVLVSTRTHDDGSFALDAARVRGAQLVTTAAGFLPDRRPIPDAAERAMTITLRAPEAKPGMLQGQVVDPRGAPMAGARVALGGALERSDKEGNFIIADDGKGPLLSAAMAGHRRAALPRPAAGFTGFVMLQLGAPPLSIRGRVVDETGKGLPGIKVWATEQTLLSTGSELHAVEGIAAGCTTMDDLRDAFRRGELADPERTLRDTSTTAWPFARTDADGAFVVTGLEERAYRLRAMDDETTLMVDSDPIAAGSADVVLGMRRDALFAVVRGQVVTRTGEPVPGVRLRVQVDAQSLGRSNMHAQASTAGTTDASGRFELNNVPRARAYLRLDGEGILPLEFGRGVDGGLLALPGGDVNNMRIEVRVRMHVKVELSDPASADTIVVHDTAGEALMINVFTGRGRNTTDALPLDDGKTPVFVVPDTASTLLLLKGGKEVRREALQLRAGDVNALRL